MLYLAIVSLIWAFSFGLIGTALSGVDPFFVATVRLGCATILFLPFFRPKLIWGINSFRLFTYGAIQFGLMYVCYMKSYEYLPSHLVALFSIMTPVYVVLINDIRKRQFSYRYLLAAILSVCGAATIKAKGMPSGDIWLGFILMQIAGLSFAFGQVAYRDWKQSHASINHTAVFSILTFGGTVFAGSFSLFFVDQASLTINAGQWQSIFYLGFFASGLGFFLWNKGAVLCNPGTLAAFNNAVVPLAVFFSLFIFGEVGVLSVEDLIRLTIGGTLIAFAVAITSNKKISI